MSQTALKYDAASVELARPILVHSQDAVTENSLDREILILGFILILLQVFDGVLTGIGIGQFGIQAEGNVLIRSLMAEWGYVPALVAVKGLAITVIIGLCALSNTVSWLAAAMRGVIVIYLAAAIIPWTSILIHHMV